jgi:hypothetical protein
MKPLGLIITALFALRVSVPIETTFDYGTANGEQ